MTRGSAVLNGQQQSNDAKALIGGRIPYVARVEVRGVAPLLFHRWSIEAIYRLTDGRLGLPGMNLTAALCEAARYAQDPRSPRKSARDLVRASVVPLDGIAPFVPDRRTWDYEDARRIAVQRARVTRVRPALTEGWRVRFSLLVNSPEYMTPEFLHALVSSAGRLVGLCDFRPTYGRFEVSHFETVDALED